MTFAGTAQIDAPIVQGKCQAGMAFPRNRPRSLPDHRHTLAIELAR